MNIPGQGRLNKKINQYRATLHRNFFVEKISNYHMENQKQNFVPFNLVSFSSNGTYFDQVLSILSFIKSVGIPYKWIVFSDGTHSKNQIERLQDFTFVEVIENINFPGELYSDGGLTEWQEKKFFAFASVDVNTTTIFLDSDVLFFPGFNNDIINAIKQKSWYLPYFEPQFDTYFLNKSEDYYHKMNYTNSGFFILNENVDWEFGKEYLKELKDKKVSLTHFSEQTAMEIVFKKNSLDFLDQKLFCLSLDDHFSLFSKINYPEIAIRHFVGPIRFRMWIAAKQFGFFLT